MHIPFKFRLGLRIKSYLFEENDLLKILQNIDYGFSQAWTGSLTGLSMQISVWGGLVPSDCRGELAHGSRQMSEVVH